MPKQTFRSIQEEIEELKTERRAVLLAHNYQIGELQDLADFTGDSIKLAQAAKKTDAEVILFCGVRFMAETASILCPDRKVIMPDPDAGCSLADMVSPEDIRRWKAAHPRGIVLCYINTSAEVKAECDCCCTSANAEKVVRNLPQDKEILFVPDFFLGSYVKQKTGRKKMRLWNGYCPAHMMIQLWQIEALKAEHKDARLIMHPECGCIGQAAPLADGVLSTDGMLRFVSGSPARKFIVATETGILHQMEKNHPHKVFIAADENSVCQYMKMNTIEKVRDSLEHLRYEVKVPEEIARRAVLPLERMLEIV